MHQFSKRPCLCESWAYNPSHTLSWSFTEDTLKLNLGQRNTCTEIFVFQVVLSTYSFQHNFEFQVVSSTYSFQHNPTFIIQFSSLRTNPSQRNSNIIFFTETYSFTLMLIINLSQRNTSTEALLVYADANNKPFTKKHLYRSLSQITFFWRHFLLHSKCFNYNLSFLYTITYTQTHLNTIFQIEIFSKLYNTWNHI